MNAPYSKQANRAKSLNSLESNFRNCLLHLNKYIMLSLLISIIYLAMLISGQQIGVPGFSVKLANEFVFALLTITYIAVGAMSIYIAERANEMAKVFSNSSPPRFQMSILSPGFSTTKYPGIRFLACYTPALIISMHLAYIGYSSSNSSIIFPIAIILSISVTLWTLLPIGKNTQ